MNAEDYALVCPGCGAQSDVDPALLQPEAPMPYCKECGEALIQHPITPLPKPKLNLVIVKFYEAAYVHEFNSIRPDLKATITIHEAAEAVALNETSQMWTPGYHTFKLDDKQLEELYKEIESKAGTLKIIGVEDL